MFREYRLIGKENSSAIKLTENLCLIDYDSSEIRHKHVFHELDAAHVSMVF